MPSNSLVGLAAMRYSRRLANAVATPLVQRSIRIPLDEYFASQIAGVAMDVSGVEVVLGTVVRSVGVPRRPTANVALVAGSGGHGLPETGQKDNGH